MAIMTRTFNLPALAALALSSLTAFALPAANSADPVAEAYAPFATLLEQYVEEHRLHQGGLVSSFAYREALADGGTEALLEQQRRNLAKFDPGNLDRREAALAFWINAYNFFMIAHILDNPVDGELIESVRDYGSLLNPYRVFDRKLFDIGGEKHALSQIELEILLGEEFAERGWKDARIHFAVNCASVGCPPLRDRPYTADNVDAMLTENTRLALKTPIHLDIDGDTLWLTSLFDWYADDFIEAAGSVRDFVTTHVDDAMMARISDTERTRFIDYDWQLNSPANIRRWIKNQNNESTNETD